MKLIRSLIKLTLSLLLPLLILRQKLRSLLKRPSGVTVLILHDVKEDEMAKLEDLLDWAKRYFSFITPAEFEEWKDGQQTLDRDHLLLSFDDGFYSNRRVAEKILAPRGIKAVFFICPDFVACPKVNLKRFIANHLFDGGRSEQDISDAERPMLKSDLKWLQDQGHCIGSHTNSHARLSELPAVQQEEEIVTSKQRVELLIGNNVNWFAYPFGDIGSVNKGALQIIAQTYSLCFTGTRGVNSENRSHLIWRESIDLRKSIRYSSLILFGGLSFFYGKQREQLKNWKYNV